MENQVNQVKSNSGIEIDLRELFILLRSRILLIILVGIIFATAATAYCYYALTPIYQAKAKLYMVSDNSNTALLTRLQEGSVIMEDYKVLVTSRPVVNQVDKNLNLDRGYGLAGSVMVTIPEETRVLEIAVNDSNPKLARDIANEFATVSMQQISRIMKVEEPTLLEEAVIPMYPIAPNKTKIVSMAFMLGILLMAMFIIIQYMMDDSIKTKSDVEKYLNVAVLASLPADKNITKSHEYENKHRHRLLLKSEDEEAAKFDAEAEEKIKIDFKLANPLATPVEEEAAESLKENEVKERDEAELLAEKKARTLEELEASAEKKAESDKHTVTKAQIKAILESRQIDATEAEVDRVFNKIKESGRKGK